MNESAPRRCVLILGGTSEARDLAAALDRAGISVVSSLAGRVARPLLPPGEVRIGGFGGPEVLASWLVEHGVVAVVDATHPFAERMSASASMACDRTGVPLLRLDRPGWRERPDDRWHWVADLHAAATVAPSLGRRILLTIGRQGVDAFAHVSSAWFLVRCIDAPSPPLPPQCAILLDRGPYTLAGELDLIDRHAIDAIVTKDSGGAPTEAKLEAARLRGLPVVVLRRPVRVGVASVSDVAGAVEWVRSALDAGRDAGR